MLPGVAIYLLIRANALIIYANMRHSHLPSMTNRVAEGALRAVARAGGSRERVAAIAKLPPFREREEQLIDIRSLGALFESASKEINDPHFGLHLGMTLDLRVMGTISYAVANAPTVGTALNNLVRFQTSFTRGFNCFYQSGSDVQVGFHLNAADTIGIRHLGELCVAIVVNTMSALLGERWQTKAAKFEHSRVKDVSVYRKVLGCDAMFNYHRTELVINKEIEQEIIPFADRQLLPIIEQRLKTFSSTDDPFLFALRTEIARTLCDGTPTVKQIPTRLQQSTRTLQRRLTERNTSFRALLEDVRKNIAEEYLKRPNADLHEIALLLGYADLSAFDHAFRQWYGEPPSSFRLRAEAAG